MSVDSYRKSYNCYTLCCHSADMMILVIVTCHILNRTSSLFAT